MSMVEVNINSPAYYSTAFGVDDDVYAMCRSIRLFVRDKNTVTRLILSGLCPPLPRNVNWKTAGGRNSAKLTARQSL